MATINGNDSSNIIVGTSNGDIINAGGGADLVMSGGGNDVINGGAGSDIIDGGSGNDTIDGGTGNDIIFGGSGNDILVIDLTGVALPNGYSSFAAYKTAIQNLFNAGHGSADFRSLAYGKLGLVVASFETIQFVGGVDNTAPTNITLAGNTIAENSAGALIGNLTVTDAQGGIMTYVVSNSSFEVVNINNVNHLRLKAGQSLNYETTPTVSLNITATDSGRLSYTKAFIINVTNVNEAPTTVTLQNQVASINENSSTASHVLVATIAVTDDALGTNNLTLAGADAGSFEIVGNQLFLKAGIILDYEAKSGYDVTVNAK